VANALKIPSSPSILTDANSSFGGHRRSCCCCVVFFFFFFFFFLWGRRVSTTSCQAADSCPSMHAAASSCCCDVDAYADTDAEADVRYVFFTLPCTPLMCRRRAAVAALSWHLTATKRKQSECKMRQLLQLLQAISSYRQHRPWLLLLTNMNEECVIKSRVMKKFNSRYSKPSGIQLKKVPTN
jgi:hypothetical protein